MTITCLFFLILAMWIFALSMICLFIIVSIVNKLHWMVVGTQYKIKLLSHLAFMLLVGVSSYVPSSGALKGVIDWCNRWLYSTNHKNIAILYFIFGIWYNKCSNYWNRLIYYNKISALNFNWATSVLSLHLVGSVEITQISIWGVPIIEFCFLLLVSYFIIKMLQNSFKLFWSFINHAAAGTLFSTVKLYLIFIFHPVITVGWSCGALIVHSLNWYFNTSISPSYFSILISRPILVVLVSYSIVGFYILSLDNFKYRIPLFIIVEYSILIFIFIYTGGLQLLYGLIVSSLVNSYMEREFKGSNTTVTVIETGAPSSPMRPLEAPSSPMRPLPSKSHRFDLCGNDTGDSSTEDPYAINKLIIQRIIRNVEFHNLRAHCPEVAAAVKSNIVSESANDPDGKLDSESITKQKAPNSNRPSATSYGARISERLGWQGWSRRQFANVLRQSNASAGNLVEFFLMTGVTYGLTRRFIMRRVSRFSTFMLNRDRILIPQRFISARFQAPINRINHLASNIVIITPIRTADLDDYWFINRWAKHSLGIEKLPYDGNGTALYYWLTVHLGTSVILTPVLMWVINHAHLFLK